MSHVKSRCGDWSWGSARVLWIGQTVEEGKYVRKMECGYNVNASGTPGSCTENKPLPARCLVTDCYPVHFIYLTTYRFEYPHSIWKKKKKKKNTVVPQKTQVMAQDKDSEGTQSESLEFPQNIDCECHGWSRDIEHWTMKRYASITL